MLCGYTLKMQGMLLECLRSSAGGLVVGVFCGQEHCQRADSQRVAIQSEYERVVGRHLNFVACQQTRQAQPKVRAVETQIRTRTP